MGDNEAAHLQIAEALPVERHCRVEEPSLLPTAPEEGWLYTTVLIEGLWLVQRLICLCMTLSLLLLLSWCTQCAKRGEFREWQIRLCAFHFRMFSFTVSD